MFGDLSSSLGVVDQLAHALSYFFLLALSNSRCSWFWQFPSSLLHQIHVTYVTPKIWSLPSHSMCWDSSPFCRWLIHWEPVISYGLWSSSSGNNTHITIPPHTFSSLSLSVSRAPTHTHTHTRMHMHFCQKFQGIHKVLDSIFGISALQPYPQWCDGVLDLQLSHLWKCVSDIMSPSIFSPSFPASLSIPDLNILPFSLYSCWLTASGHI